MKNVSKVPVSFLGLINALGTALEGLSVLCLATASQSPTLLLELVHADWRHGGSIVVAGGVVMDLVDGDGSVYHMGLDDFLLYDRLDGFVDVVVDLLALHNWRLILGVGCICHNPLVSQLSGLSPQRPFGGLLVVVVNFPMDDVAGPVSVLFRQNLSVLDRLHHVSVVILMELFVNGGVDFFVLGRLDRLVLDGRGDFLVHGGVMMSGFGQEVADCCLGFLHSKGP
jgi:hypothetical protein